MNTKIIGILTFLFSNSVMAANTERYYECKGNTEFAPKMTVSTWVNLLHPNPSSSVVANYYIYSQVKTFKKSGLLRTKKLPEIYFDVQTALPENITVQENGSIEIRSASTNEPLLSMNSDLSENYIFNVVTNSMVPARCSYSDKF